MPRRKSRWSSPASAIRGELRYCRRVMLDPRTPRTCRWLLAGAIAYLLSPIDLIPDFVPVLGHLDDALVVPALIALALRLAPPEVRHDARAAGRRAAPDA